MGDQANARLAVRPQFQWPAPRPGQEPGGQLPRYRHATSSNLLWLDGHVKAKVRGQLNWYRDVYVPSVSDNGLPGVAVN